MPPIDVIGRQLGSFDAITPVMADAAACLLTTGGVGRASDANWRYMKRMTSNNKVSSNRLYCLCSKGYRPWLF